jgi:hypothetical protein
MNKEDYILTASLPLTIKAQYQPSYKFAEGLKLAFKRYGRSLSAFGELTLTKDELIFQPSSSRSSKIFTAKEVQKEVRIKINVISSINRRVNGIYIELKNDEKHWFVIRRVSQAKGLAERISVMAGLGKQV